MAYNRSSIAFKKFLSHMKSFSKFIKNIGANPLRLVSIFLNRRIGYKGFAKRKKFTSLESLIDDHFNNYSNPNHPCRDSLTRALKMLGNQPAQIMETGSSAWGANSSMLFDSYVNSFGGSFLSVDIRINPMINLLRVCTERSKFYCNDSISFLKRLPNPGVSLVYLDSWDVDWTNPLPSSLHGFSEFMEILYFFTPGSLLLIDDTPIDSVIMEKVHPNHLKSFITFKEKYGFAPGKGALVLNYLKQFGRGEIISHDYQLLVKF